MICSIDLIATGCSIRRTMQTRGVCVKDIAQILNVSTQTVYKWLNGQSLPTLENVIALSSYLGVSVEELIIKKVRYEYSVPDYMVREDISIITWLVYIPKTRLSYNIYDIEIRTNFTGDENKDLSFCL